MKVGVDPECRCSKFEAVLPHLRSIVGRSVNFPSTKFHVVGAWASPVYRLWTRPTTWRSCAFDCETSMMSHVSLRQQGLALSCYQERLNQLIVYFVQDIDPRGTLERMSGTSHAHPSHGCAPLLASNPCFLQAARSYGSCIC